MWRHVSAAISRPVIDGVVFTDRSEIVEQGTPSEFFSRPKELRARTFLSQILH
jgi:ABC-type polar amino acid transport system ATPase subunit